MIILIFMRFRDCASLGMFLQDYLIFANSCIQQYHGSIAANSGVSTVNNNKNMRVYLVAMVTKFVFRALTTFVPLNCSHVFLTYRYLVE